jgi:hypothetical protein
VQIVGWRKNQWAFVSCPRRHIARLGAPSTIHLCPCTLTVLLREQRAPGSGDLLCEHACDRAELLVASLCAEARLARAFNHKTVVTTAMSRKEILSAVPDARIKTQRAVTNRSFRQRKPLTKHPQALQARRPLRAPERPPRCFVARLNQELEYAAVEWTRRHPMARECEFREFACPVEVIDAPCYAVRWRDMREEELAEPAFQESLVRIRRERPQALEIADSFASLISHDPHQLGTPPSGFIFHVSRCGSTLVANALRATGRFRVISEAGLINALLRSSFFRSHKGTPLLLRNALTLLGNRVSTQRMPYVVKFSSWNLFQIQQIRWLWPNVPWIFLYRQPTSIAASILESPVGWMAGHHSEEDCRDLGIPTNDARGSREEYIARVLGQLASKALTEIDTAAAVIEYERLSLQLLRQVSSLFGEELTGAELRLLQQALGTDSKDRLQVKPFRPQIRVQSAEATRAIDRWARVHFDRLPQTSI